MFSNILSWTIDLSTYTKLNKSITKRLNFDWDTSIDKSFLKWFLIENLQELIKV